MVVERLQRRTKTKLIWFQLGCGVTDQHHTIKSCAVCHSSWVVEWPISTTPSSLGLCVISVGLWSDRSAPHHQVLRCVSFQLGCGVTDRHHTIKSCAVCHFSWVVEWPISTTPSSLALCVISVGLWSDRSAPHHQVLDCVWFQLDCGVTDQHHTIKSCTVCLH